MPSLPKQRAPKGNTSQSSSSVVDPRFAALGTDPRFRLPSKKNTRVKLDKRFSRLLKDKDFTQQASVDRYGRKISKTQGRKRLERLYELPSDEDDEDDEDEHDEDKGLGSESGEDDEVVIKQLKKAKHKYDPARDGGFSTSESDSDSDDSDVESEIDGELPEESEAVPLGEVAKRIAVVNLDWDNVRAEDIFAVAGSFATDRGTVLNVTVYPSEFGRERMDREDLEGPPKEIFAGKPQSLEPLTDPSTRQNDVDEDEDEDEEDSEEEEEKIKKALVQSDDGAEFDSTALRKYQLDRLRYYYAVISCSSKDVAKALYDAMDGQEYLSSANFFDMRFVPDDVTFDEKPRDSCNSLPEDYNPTEFTTDALMHSKVKLTWDADDNKRKEIQKKAFSRTELKENDLLAYIGSNSSSSEFESEEEDIPEDDASVDAISTASRATSRQAKRDALRASLGLDLEPQPSSGSKKRENRPVGNMEITFTPALSSSNKGGSVFENEPLPYGETTMEKYARKERERKVKRKERAKARRNGEVADAAAEEADEGQDEGFNDSFFENPDAAMAEAKRARKSQRVRFADEQDLSKDVDDTKRAELELLMMEDGAEQSTMTQNRSEKLSTKKRKEKKKQGKKAAVDEDADGFQVDVNDPRLGSLYTDPDFAIDPTSHLFKDTKGTRAILDEKRRRGEKREVEKEKRPRGEVNDLIERVKKRAKR
jgi:NUC153 domain